MTANKNFLNEKKIQKKFNISLSQDVFLTILLFLIILIIISNPTKYTSGTISGLKLFFFNVLPGLFPFMLLTKLITEIGLIFRISQKLDKFSYKIFGTPGVSIYTLIISVISGYPIGAKIISDLYNKKQINEIEAKKMSIFCTTSGPMFIIGTVGSIMFKNIQYGIILYISHISTSIIMGIVYNLLTTNNVNTLTSSNHIVITKTTNIINTCVNQTINSLFIVGAYITIFYLLSELLDSLCLIEILTNIISTPLHKIGINPAHIKGFFYGILEVTRGAKELSIVADNTSIAITCGLLSFSGLSIIMQSMNFLKEAKIKAHNFIISKCVHMILSIFICYILLIIIN